MNRVHTFMMLFLLALVMVLGACVPSAFTRRHRNDFPVNPTTSCVETNQTISGMAK
jgi:hypothetical protein